MSKIKKSDLKILQQEVDDLRARVVALELQHEEGISTSYQFDERWDD